MVLLDEERALISIRYTREQRPQTSVRKHSSRSLAAAASLALAAWPSSYRSYSLRGRNGTRGGA